MIEIVNDTNHPEHEDYKEWLGEIFDSIYFDIEEANEMIASEDYGVIDMFDSF